MGYFLFREEEYDELWGQRRARSGRIAPSDEVTRFWKRVSDEEGAVIVTELIQSVVLEYGAGVYNERGMEIYIIVCMALALEAVVSVEMGLGLPVMSSSGCLL